MARSHYSLTRGPRRKSLARVSGWYGLLLAAVVWFLPHHTPGQESPPDTLAPVPDAITEPRATSKRQDVAHDPLRPVAVRRAALAAAAHGGEHDPELAPPVPLPVIDQQLIRPEIVPSQAGDLWIFRVAGAPADSDLAWSIVPEIDGFAEDSSGMLAYAAFAEPRLYHVVVSMAEGGKASTLIYPVLIGPEPLPPAPDQPPGPVTPPTAPGPTAPVGPRVLILVHETKNRPVALANLIVSLRVGETAKRLTDGGHKLYVLDDDATDKDGNPTVLATWLPHLEGVPLPALIVATPPSAGQSAKFIAATTLAADATAAEVEQFLKLHGGR